MFRTALKVAVIGALALLLFVPVSMIQGLVAERQLRRDQAVRGIAEGWGRQQTLTTPYIAVPYERSWTEVTQEIVDGKAKEKRVERSEHAVARFRADRMQWAVSVAVSEKARGIYKARLYTASIKASGRIAVPARLGLTDTQSRFRWDLPRLVVAIADPKGLRSVSALTLDGAARAFEPGTGDALLHGGLNAPVAELNPVAPARTFEFSFSLEVAGLEAFSIAPLGADTVVAMRADWPHPSFQGQFLPARHAVDRGGFAADWRISQFAAQGEERTLPSCAKGCALNLQQLGVSFIEPAGLYQQLERASKYGFLFIGLTFAAFQLLELLRRLAIHPVQYALVGLALAMFFLLLTALSEHLSFAAAYAVATLACVGLISGYLVRALRSATLGLAFGAGLAALFGALFALLRAEDYALLGGSLLLFALLAALMIATRRVDWYGLAAKPV